jgi:hypothetical protein
VGSVAASCGDGGRDGSDDARLDGEGIRNDCGANSAPLGESGAGSAPLGIGGVAEPPPPIAASSLLPLLFTSWTLLFTSWTIPPPLWGSPAPGVRKGSRVWRELPRIDPFEAWLRGDSGASGSTSSNVTHARICKAYRQEAVSDHRRWHSVALGGKRRQSRAHLAVGQQVLLKHGCQLLRLKDGDRAVLQPCVAEDVQRTRENLDRKRA